LNNISKLELENDKKAIDEFNMAVNNLETRSKTDKGCFRNQTNSKWKIDLEASSKLCNALGFSNCQRYDNENGEQQFNGFSLNDPASFLKDTNYVEYVSFDSDDFRLEYKEKFEKLSSKYNIFSEVYTHNVNGKDIYKYNIVAIDKSYIIGCSKPK
ncbi:MAG: hypothetical protein RR543_02150, partial [Erysipelotrichales bacterium]